MVAQKGKDLLLKISDRAGYVTVAGLRSRRLAFNTEAVDVTDAESAGRWRELLGGVGVLRASLTGAGIVKDQVSDALVRTAFFGGTILSWQVVIPNFGTITGPFQIFALEYSGEHNGEVRFELAVEISRRAPFLGALIMAGGPANRRRGEVEAVIDGERRVLCLTLGALAELETAFGAGDLNGLAERFASGWLKAADMIRILGAGLRGGSGDREGIGPSTSRELDPSTRIMQGNIHPACFIWN